MSARLSPIWLRMLPDIDKRIVACLDAACEHLGKNGPANVFFRADDVAVPGKNFVKLMQIFVRNRVPLNLAVVPAWLTDDRWKYLRNAGGYEPKFLCWHQHGWRHVSHELAGKKQEFGPGRIAVDVEKDLLQGRQRLEQILGKNFCPVFTPPWNRCSAAAMRLLQKHDYIGVSRSVNASPLPPKGLRDFFVNMDLHTRKERAPVSDWKFLLSELGNGIAAGHLGIMIHHQRMNAAAFDFLEILFQAVKMKNELQLVSFRELFKDTNP